MKNWRWGLLIAYGALVVLALGYLELYINLDPGHSEFSGLPLIILGLPWSVGIPQLVGPSDGSHLVGWMAMVGGIILNGIIPRIIGGMIDPRVPRTPRK